MVAGLRQDAIGIFRTALAAVDPARMVAPYVDADARELTLRDRDGRVCARHRGPVLIVGAGKAAAGMVSGIAARAAGLVAGGLAIVPHDGVGLALAPIDLLRGAHPVPDQAGAAATARLLAAVRSLDARTLVVACLSGGASALLVAPAGELTLTDKRAVTEQLLLAGADVEALNTVRKHCSRVKGGGLARAAAATAGLWALVLSDVVGDDLATIASGPTVADPSTYLDATRVLERYVEPPAVPPAVARHLALGRAGSVPETVKPGDVVLDRVHTLVVGGNGDAVAAAATAARARGYRVDALPAISGDAAVAGRMVAERLHAAPGTGPLALIGGGETTVRVVAGGSGGRSQHLALAAAIAMAGRPGVLLAAGTDGIDGPTDAAGACVDGGTMARARTHGFDAHATLAATDSHRLLAATGDLLRTGPTGTNVADLVVALRGAC
jgi:glycerate-2-kinase